MAQAGWYAGAGCATGAPWTGCPAGARRSVSTIVVSSNGRLGEDGAMPAPRATVVAHSASGHPNHLTFTVGVDGPDDGMPVLDIAGRVVGIAEPSAPFGTERWGYALPITAACLAVRAC